MQVRMDQAHSSKAIRRHNKECYRSEPPGKLRHRTNIAHLETLNHNRSIHLQRNEVKHLVDDQAHWKQLAPALCSLGAYIYLITLQLTTQQLHTLQLIYVVVKYVLVNYVVVKYVVVNFPIINSTRPRQEPDNVIDFEFVA